MDSDWVKETAGLVSRYVIRNELSQEALGPLLHEVHATLRALAGGRGEGMSPPVAHEETPLAETPPARRAGRKRKERPQPVVAVTDSWSETAVVCLICGRSCQVLTGHLSRIHHLQPEQYREMFGLAKEHPLVAPRYSDKRRTMARDNNQAEKMLQGRRAKKAAV